MMHVQALRPLTNAHASRMDLYLDSATGLPVAYEFNLHPDGNMLQDIPAAVEFGDYRSTPAGMAPFHIRKFVQRALLLDIPVTNVSDGQ